MIFLFLVRPMMKAADRVRRIWWRVKGKTIYGVMVLPYTPDGRIVLVRQTYLPGWGLPGGGRRLTENPVATALRELREEVGMIRWTGATHLGTVDCTLSRVPAAIDLIRVEGMEFSFRPNLEVESVSAFDRKNLPADLHDWSAKFLSREGEGFA